MLERGRGTIVNVSSYAAIRPSPNTSGYAAAKAALLNLTGTLAAETAGRGVVVFAISPGFVRTAMTDRVRESGLVPGAGSGREVEAERAGRLVAFLASGVGLDDVGLETVVGELLTAERPREEAAFVLDSLELDQGGAGKLELAEPQSAQRKSSSRRPSSRSCCRRLSRVKRGPSNCSKVRPAVR